MNKQSCVHMDVRVGEALSLDGGRIRVELEEKSGRAARLKVTAPMDVEVKKQDGSTASAMRAIQES